MAGRREGPNSVSVNHVPGGAGWQLSSGNSGFPTGTVLLQPRWKSRQHRRQAGRHRQPCRRRFQERLLVRQQHSADSRLIVKGTFRFNVGFILLALFAGVVTSSATADDESSSAPVKGTWGPGAVTIGAWKLDPTSGDFVWAEPGTVATDPYQYKYELQCHLGGGDFDTDCLALAVDCQNGPDGKDGIPVVWLKAPAGIPNPTWTFHSGPTCLFDPKPEDLLPRIAAMIKTEFQRLPVAAGSVTAQPSPHTLRGAETNFFAEAAQQQFDITILAQKVHVVAKPVQYTWNNGDGSSLGPQTAGR